MGLLVALAFLAGLVTPPGAKAATAPGLESIFESGGESPAEFRAKGSNGYSIRVEGSRGSVTLTATGPSGTATYRVPGRVSTREIAADFGRRGRVEVEFRPSRRTQVERPPNRCKGKPRVTRWGVFVGTIRFAGEHGYSRLRLGRVSGRTHLTPNWKCKRGRGDSGQPGKGEEPSVPGETSEDALVLEISNRRTGLEAGAFTYRPPGEKGLTLFVAGAEEQRERMRIVRFAFVPAGNLSFSFDESLTAATIAPPAPFSGSATFQRNAGAPASWTGSLAVALPGTARISLVGADYQARLYRLSEDGLAKPGI